MKEDSPQVLSNKYETQNFIKPADPVLVIKKEGEMITTFISWGFISPWERYPFDKSRIRPFNARSKTFEEKEIIQG